MKKKTTHSTPPHYDETEAYRRFNSVFFPASIFSMILFNYLAFYFRSACGNFSERVVTALPFTESRLRFLADIDHTSYEAYISTMFSGMITFTIFFLISGFAYYKIVVARGECKKLGAGFTKLLARSLLLIAAFLFVIFVFAPSEYHPRRLGSMRVLLWPVFPTVGALAVFTSALVLFASLVGVLKAIWQALSIDK